MPYTPNQEQVFWDTFLASKASSGPLALQDILDLKPDLRETKLYHLEAQKPRNLQNPDA